MTTAREHARALYAARAERAAIPPLTESEPGLTAAGGYEIQQELVRMLVADGDAVVGWKLGLTSKPMQDMLGVGEPDYAPQLRSMVVDDGAVLAVGDYIQPRVEAEVALLLGRPLEGPGVTLLQAAQAVEGGIAAIEIVDSRIRDWQIELPDTIADLASSGASVLAGRVAPLDFDVRTCGMVITRNGVTAATGAGAAALGSPVRAVAWLANTLAPFGVTLEAGQFIMTGALHAAFPVDPGDLVRAEFDRLGPVSVRFS